MRDTHTSILAWQVPLPLGGGGDGAGAGAGGWAVHVALKGAQAWHRPQVWSQVPFGIKQLPLSQQVVALYCAPSTLWL